MFLKKLIQIKEKDGYLEGAESVESAITEGLNAGTIEVKSPEVLPADESMAGELGQVISI